MFQRLSPPVFVLGICLRKSIDGILTFFFIAKLNSIIYWFQRSVSGSQPSDLVKTIDELNQQLDRASRDSRGSEDASRPPHPRGIGNSPPKLRPGGHKQPQEESQPRVGWEDYVETLEKHSARNSASSSNSTAGDEKCFVLSNVVSILLCYGTF